MKTLIQIWKTALMITLIVTSMTIIAQTQRETVFTEDWEGDWLTNWHVDAGTWEVGTPTSGPDSAYYSSKCAATVLAGNYSEPVDSRLIRHTSFIVPSTSENPRLRFWHWYSFSSGDYGVVQISIDGGSSWEIISESYTSTGSGIWTYPFIDLSAYTGSTVQIAFYFHSHQVGYYGNVSTGWYIDDVELITGEIVFNNPEGFELGIGNWAAERGTWEVGEPTSGPGDAYSGQNCAATRLDGNYAEPVDSRLISPPFIVPSAPQNPRLRFWHWYSFSSGDYGKVQISVNGGDWQDIFIDYTSTGSGVWTYPFIDLSTFADSTVQFAFYFHSHQVGYYGNVSTGWYIDDVEVITGQIAFNNPEGFELGIGDWAAERGTWEVGEPTMGPDSAYSPPNCAGTVLDGNYAEPVDSRIIMPSFVVPSGGLNPALQFWHWYSFSSGDYGEVQIKVEEGAWQPISNQFTNTSSNIWTPFYIPLSPYADSMVQIAFYFHSHQVGYYGNVSTGWYIDEVEILPDVVGIKEYTDNNNQLQIKLSQNYPNPFTQQTKIHYTILNDENVQLSIYNINGELIKTIVNERQKRGDYSVIWQGKNEQNSRVSPGIYFYELKTGKNLILKKMLLLK